MRKFTLKLRSSFLSDGCREESMITTRIPRTGSYSVPELIDVSVRCFPLLSFRRSVQLMAPKSNRSKLRLHAHDCCHRFRCDVDELGTRKDSWEWGDPDYRYSFPQGESTGATYPSFRAVQLIVGRWSHRMDATSSSLLGKKLRPLFKPSLPTFVFPFLSFSRCRFSIGSFLLRVHRLFFWRLLMTTSRLIFAPPSSSHSLCMTPHFSSRIPLLRSLSF